MTMTILSMKIIIYFVLVSYDCYLCMSLFIRMFASRSLFYQCYSTASHLLADLMERDQLLHDWKNMNERSIIIIVRLLRMTATVSVKVITIFDTFIQLISQVESMKVLAQVQEREGNNNNNDDNNNNSNNENNNDNSEKSVC